MGGTAEGAGSRAAVWSVQSGPRSHEVTAALLQVRWCNNKDLEVSSIEIQRSPDPVRQKVGMHLLI